MPAEFPFPSVSASNPTPLYFEMLPEQFVVGKTVYDDNGADYKLQNGGSGVKQWIVKYDGLTLTEAAILDAWVVTMFYSDDEGSAYGANFRHHVAGTLWSDTSGTLYSGVHIAPGGYKTRHSVVGAQAREFILEKRP